MKVAAKCSAGHRWETIDHESATVFGSKLRCAECGALADEDSCETISDAAPNPSPNPAINADTAPTELASAPAPAKPLSIPGYEILAEVGRGGMGVVYKARQLNLQRLVALKMILAGEFADPELIKRFQSEALAVARLQHPNIVQIFESGTYGSQPYFSMEYVDGCSLARWIGISPPSPQAAATLLETLARAIHYAHQNGIIHRDLKPANILLSGAWRVARGENRMDSSLATQPKITDFGLAKLVDGGPDARSMTTNALGTPEYMAPEQIAGARPSPATDIYSLGVILYEMLVGRCPFQGDTKWLTLELVRGQEPISPVRLKASTPRDLETICLKCLSKEPAQRYATAQALADDLQRFLNGEPIQARPISDLEKLGRWCKRKPLVAGLLAALIAVSVAGFAGVAWGYWEAESARRDEQQKRQEADEARRQATEQRRQAEKNLYFSRIALAERFLVANNIAGARRLLRQCLPDAAAPDWRDWEWYYLDRQCHQELFTLEGHTSHIFHLAYSPNGTLLASAGGGNPYYRNEGQKTEPGEVILWNSATGARLFTLTGHAHLVTSLAFSPDGARLISGSHDRTIKVWECATGKLLFSATGHKEAVLRVGYSPTGKYLATVGADRVLKLWDAATGKELHSYVGDDLVFDRAETQLAITAEHGTNVYDLKTGEGKLTLPQARGAVAFSPNGRLLATGAPVVKLWDLAGPTEPIATSTLTVDGAELGADGILLGAVNREQLLQFSPDGKLLVAVDKEQLFILDGETGQVRHHLVGHNGGISAAVFMPDGQALVTSGADQTVRVWDMATGREKFAFRGHTHSVNIVAIRPDGRQLASGGIDTAVRLWDPSCDPRGLTFTVDRGAGEHLKSFTFSADGRSLLLNMKKALQTYDATSGSQLSSQPIDIIDKWLCPRGDVAFSANGRFLAAPAFNDYRIAKVWEAATCQEVGSFPSHGKVVRGLAVSADGQWLAAGEGSSYDKELDGSITIWDVAGRREVNRLTGLHQVITALTFNPDGHRLAGAGERDGSVRVWDVLTGNQLFELTGCKQVFSIAFSPDGKKLAATDWEGDKVCVWDAATGAELYTIPEVLTPTCVTFSPNGRRLATAGYYGQVHLWDAATGQESFTLHSFAQARQGDYAFMARAVFSPDGRRLASNNWDGTINVWDVAEKEPAPSSKSP
jgi:WD40 repeat protein/serine/threonine protein kinase